MYKFIRPNPAKSVKWRSVIVYAYTMIFSLGCIAAIFGGLNAVGVVSDKGLNSFWEWAPLSSILIGVIAGVHYMYTELKAEADYFRMLYEDRSHSQSIYN
jgi:hypothetical protein